MAALVFAEPPPETDAWWLSRSQTPTFSKRRIALPAACARALRSMGDAALIVVFNDTSFEGASVAAHAGRYELDLGDALAQAMAEVLDEDDGLDIEVITGPSQPMLAIHPYVIAAG